MNAYHVFLKWSVLFLVFATLSSCSKQELPAQLSEKEVLLQQFKDLYQDFRAVKLGSPYYGTRAQQDDLRARLKVQGETYIAKVEEVFFSNSAEENLTVEEARQMREELKKEIFDEDVLAYRAFIRKRVEPLSIVLDQIYTLTNGKLGEYYPSLKGLPAIDCYEWLLAQGAIYPINS